MPTPDISVDELLTDAQLRELLGISRTTLWRLRKHAGLPFGKIGRSYRYRKAEVLRWIAENPGKSPVTQVEAPVPAITIRAEGESL